MSQRSVCNQFTPQLWRATKCKFCFNDKESHEKASKENITTTNTNITTSPTTLLSPKIKRLSSTFIKSDENLPRSPSRRNTGSNSDESQKSLLSSDSDGTKTRPSRVSRLTYFGITFFAVRILNALHFLCTLSTF